MTGLRGLFSTTAICILAGILGGLLLGYALSRQGGWLTPTPWIVYGVGLLGATAIVTWLDERRRLRRIEATWPLPPGFRLPEDTEPDGASERGDQLDTGAAGDGEPQAALPLPGEAPDEREAALATLVPGAEADAHHVISTPVEAEC